MAFAMVRGWALLLILAMWSVQAAAAAKPPLHVVISIDTETSAGCGPHGCIPVPIEDRILGLHGGRYYGIDLMMDLLEKHGMRGTFFVNSFLDAAYPDNEIETFVQRIQTRGHDVQFHAHAEFRCLRLCPRRDPGCWRQCTRHESFIGGNSYEAQLAILREGVRNIERWTGSYPVAFRGGSFDADETTIRVLRALGIRFDSSMDLPSHGLSKLYAANRVADHEGVVEIPLYAFRDDILGRQLNKFADMESLSLFELKKLVRTAERHDLRTAVFIMHSFSFCREPDSCPNRQGVDIFDRFLSFLQSEPGVRVITVKELAREYEQKPMDFIGSGYVPTYGYWTVLYRSFNRFTLSSNNRVFALANLAAALLLLALIFATIKALYRRWRSDNPA